MAFHYFIGVDGGGTGTRVVVADASANVIARASGGPSALGLGIELAWQNVLAAIQTAFGDLQRPFPTLNECAIGLGLSGVHNPEWAAEFRRQSPGFKQLSLITDGFSTLLGAHHGEPGAIVAVGTGLVGEAWYGHANVRTVSAWGFPSGDEGSGAWIGLQAAQLAEKALDGRALRGSLAADIIELWGGTTEAAFSWLGAATQTRYAQLAPLVLKHARHDTAAEKILLRAGVEIAEVAEALDPRHDLPLALCGGLADALKPWLPESLNSRAVPPKGDSATGALLLAIRESNGG